MVERLVVSMERTGDDLPSSWVWTTVGVICSKPQYGWTTKANATSGTVRLLRTTDITSGRIHWNSVPYCTAVPKPVEPYLLQAGDIVISRAGSVGFSALLTSVPLPAVFASYLIRFKPRHGICPRYLSYYFQTQAYWTAISEQAAGIALLNVNARKLEAINVPLAPTAEQERIVEAIETQFTRLDACTAGLKAIQAKLKRYRAAVLKAAVDGTLTAAWRARHPDVEPASVLLQRILQERRNAWEQAELAKYAKAGKMPPKGWENRYVEPVAPYDADLPELPDGWCWATVAQLAAAEANAITDGPFGSNLKTEHYTAAGPRVIRLQNIGDGVFRDDKVFISETHYRSLRKHEIVVGDLVIAALGDNPPRSCIIPEYVGPAIGKADCIRFKTSPHVLNSYINYALNAEPTRRRTASLLHGIGRPRLNLTEIKSILIPVPSDAEQEQIVAEVERRLSVVAEMEAQIQAALKRADRLRQSILKEAFAGRLVPQDPEDEPANVLLERIKAQRNGRATRGTDTHAVQLQLI